MAVLESIKAPTDPAASGPATDGVLALLNSLQSCTSRADAYRRSLQCIATYLNSPFALLSVETATTNFSEQFSVGDEATRAWKRHCDGMLLAANHSGTSRARLFQSSGTHRTFAVLSAPMPDETGSLVGSLALVIGCDNNALAEVRLSELTSLIRAAAIFGVPKTTNGASVKPGISSVAASDKSTTASSTAALSKLSGCESLHEFAFSMVNDLKGKIGADQVSMGIVRGNSTTILCTSGFDNLYPRSPGSQTIQQAMSECLDAGEIVCFQRTGCTVLSN